MDIREQLTHLRQTIATIDRKYAGLPSPPPAPRVEPDSAGFVEELLAGEVVETPLGKHFETEKLYPRHRRYGSYEISDLIELPHDLLASLSDGAIPCTGPTRWAFLDTETTGLAGGSGTYAFLIGVGSIDLEGFRVRQFFMRDYSEEPSLLYALTRYLADFEVLITYNGKSFDQPLLETRYTMCRKYLRAAHPFGRMVHLDLLYGARRLFKLRLENCRLVNLEYQILGLERDADVPGELIPYYYFEYLRTRHAFRLIPVFHHNVLDIVSLACLAGLIPAAFRDPENMQARHGTDLLGLARWLQVSGRLEEAHRLMRRAIHMGLPDQHLFRALFDTGNLEKKLRLDHAALATFTGLTESPNPFRGKAFEELAKHYEHRERNFRMALECARAARCEEDSKALEARQRRLEIRCARVSRQTTLR